MRQILVAWFLLGALSAASTVLSLGVIAAPLSGFLLVALAWAKARTILNDYLGLGNAPFWRRGFELVVGFYVAGLAALYALA